MPRSMRSLTFAAACALALCSCSHGGPVQLAERPPVTLQPLPADMMATPKFGARARSRLFQTPTTPTAGSAGSSPN